MDLDKDLEIFFGCPYFSKDEVYGSGHGLENILHKLETILQMSRIKDWINTCTYSSDFEWDEQRHRLANIL